MERLSATEASRRFSDLLDAVEARREVFVVIRRGRAVATIGPAVGATGSRAREILRDHPPDPTWADDLRDLRDSLAGDAEPWHG
jgi:antitoxin (DNA-binding transcriptional repressor) of toxin-antitoxin stability system